MLILNIKIMNNLKNSSKQTWEEVRGLSWIFFEE